MLMNKNSEVIVLHDVLTFTNNKAYFNNELFSGGAVSFTDDKVTQRTRFKHGEAVGEFNSKYISYQAEHHYDGQYLEMYDEDSYTYHGEFGITGVFYSFWQGLCYQIISIEKGRNVIDETVFFPDCDIRSLVKREQILKQYMDKHENHNYHDYCFIINDKSSKPPSNLNLRFNDKGQLNSLTLRNNVLAKLPQYASRIHFPDFITKTAILALEVAPRLTFLDNDITDEFIADMFASKEIAKLTLEDVALYSTSVTYQSLVLFSKIEKLKRLEYSKKDGLSIDDLIAFKRLRPDCTVVLGEEEITLDD